MGDSAAGCKDASRRIWRDDDEISARSWTDGKEEGASGTRSMGKPSLVQGRPYQVPDTEKG